MPSNIIKLLFSTKVPLALKSLVLTNAYKSSQLWTSYGRKLHSHKAPGKSFNMAKSNETMEFHWRLQIHSPNYTYNRSQRVNQKGVWQRLGRVSRILPIENFVWDGERALWAPACSTRIAVLLPHILDLSFHQSFVVLQFMIRVPLGAFTKYVTLNRGGGGCLGHFWIVTQKRYDLPIGVGGVRWWKNRNAAVWFFPNISCDSEEMMNIQHKNTKKRWKAHQWT